VPAPGAATVFATPFGSFALHRYPSREREPLQAWCGADRLLLEAAHERGLAGEQVLVVNDSHGALTLPLKPRALWTDSSLAATALRDNEARNGAPATAVGWSTEEPPGPARAIVMRIPRQRLYFEYQLSRLARILPAGGTVLAGGMDKHLSPRSAALMEQYIGPTERCPGRHKARVFSASRDASVQSSAPPSPGFFCDVLGARLTALPNVFSPDRLDNGTRFLLEHLDQLAVVDTLLDLACGHGVLGLAAFRRGLAARVRFCDESAMAIASARNNATRLFPQSAAVFDYVHGDGARPLKGAAPELILLNPPFHLEGAVDEFAGRRLIRQSASLLAPAGALCLVANRHLNYRPLLGRLFSAVDELAANHKFRVLLARRD
jgi:16S rRNA G1207 methylase RsmC